MLLQNLVFNRLGNSFSALLYYNTNNIQLWDDVKTDTFEIKDICSSQNSFTVFLSIKDKIYEIVFDDRGFSLGNKKFFVEDEGFSKEVKDTEEIFKISMANLHYIKTKKNNDIKIFIPQHNFFKGVAEYINTISL